MKKLIVSDVIDLMPKLNEKKIAKLRKKLSDLSKKRFQIIKDQFKKQIDIPELKDVEEEIKKLKAQINELSQVSSLIEESAFEDLTLEAKKAYLKEHPHSKFGHEALLDSSALKKHADKIKHYNEQLAFDDHTLSSPKNSLGDEQIKEIHNSMTKARDDIEPSRKAIARHLLADSYAKRLHWLKDPVERKRYDYSEEKFKKDAKDFEKLHDNIERGYNQFDVINDSTQFFVKDYKKGKHYSVESSVEDNSQVKALETKVENLLNQIRQLNTQLDNKNLSKEQKDSIHDRLDRLKDQRKETSLKLSDLKIKLGKQKQSASTKNHMKTTSAIETANWFDNLSEDAQKEYLKEHKGSKLLPKNKLAEHHETVRDLNKLKIQHLNAGNLDKVKEINKKISPAWNAIMDHNKEQHEKQSDYNIKTGTTTKEQQKKIDDSWKAKQKASLTDNTKQKLAKIKVVCSDWFEALTEKQQKQYLDEHPDSKFAHKLGKSNPNKSIVKDKKAIKEHLEGEGVDLNKDYFNMHSNDAHKLNTVHKMAGKAPSTKGKSRGRALLDSLQKASTETV